MEAIYSYFDRDYDFGDDKTQQAGTREACSGRDATKSWTPAAAKITFGVFSQLIWQIEDLLPSNLR